MHFFTLASSIPFLSLLLSTATSHSHSIPADQPQNMHQYHTHQHPLLCLYCHPRSYIRMVQHVIERCLLLHMTQEQCVKALAVHARIAPPVTLTVWKELQKENKDFFRAYYSHNFSPCRPFTGRDFQRGQRLARRR